MTFRHGGDLAGYERKYGRAPLDFSANVSPFGMPEAARRAAEEALRKAHSYPDPFCRELREALSASLSVPAEWILCGNGASDLIYRLVCASRPRHAYIAVPTFSEYRSALEAAGCRVTCHVLHEENDFELTDAFLEGITPDTDLVFLCQPNNPTGRTVDADLLGRILQKCDDTGTLLAVDECFLPFLEKPEEYSLLPDLLGHRLMILRAFTKYEGMAGLRLGYCVCEDTVLLEEMSKAGPPWPVSSVAQAAGIAALRDEETRGRIRELIPAERTRLAEGLREAGCRVIPGEANFLLFYGEENLGERMEREGILIRDCKNFEGLSSGWYRTAVRTPAENRRLLEALNRREPFSPHSCGTRLSHGNAGRIMVQGTMSGVGKSLLVTALCRIFHQDGYRTAPFKSQNMALNSFITKDGREMGRAQALQAFSSGKEPDVRMNPVLLKPTGDTGSQVIVNGEVYGDYRAADYFKIKKSLIPRILESYESLASENDIIVIEGAGSPAEINLKKDDIVNMGLAELLDAPVILTGDIDPGGVFAQIYGTVKLLDPKEQRRIIGTVINKFRGDPEILRPGLSMLEDLTGIPVLGVVPFLNLELDEEDSLSDVFRKRDADRPVDIAVIRLPRISNFTDFTPLGLHPSLGVRYVGDANHLGSPDLVILPGTKNTMGDLVWLRENGLEARILRLASAGTPVLGICGGYQMLGQSISDPECAEHGGEMRGMGLLPARTVFSRKKTQTQTTAVCAAPFAGARIRGYQIHMGQTITDGAEPFCILEEGRTDGARRGNVFGTYLHGLFDTGLLTEALASWLCRRKGTAPESAAPMDYESFRESQLDLLAETVRESLDMQAIYRAVARY